MIALCRADDVRIISDGDGGWTAVPDLKLPEWVKWGAYEVSGQKAFIMWFEIRGKRHTSLWYGPMSYLGTKLFIVDFPDDESRASLVWLRNRLGGHGMATPLHRAIRNRPSIWTWLQGKRWFKPVRNAQNKTIGMYTPLTICGRKPYDLDYDDPETADEIPED
jgi:hypothetical protein